MSSIRILTYNIHGGVGRDGRRDLSRIGEFLERHQIDIVLLQELNLRSSEESAECKLRSLRRDRFEHVILAPTIIRIDRSYGNAILSRFPIEKSSIMDISRRGREPRNIVEAVINTPRRQIRVMNTHKGLGYFERRRQMAILNELLDEKKDLPLIVGGDINEWQVFSPGLIKLNRNLQPFTTGPTFPTGLPIFSLDRMWCRPKGLISSVQVIRTAETKLFSDHFPLLANVSLSCKSLR